MSKRPSLLSGLSAFQVAAGSLAAMTSAWVASTLGVAGTIVGAAIASLVLSTSSAIYANTLHKGRTLVVQTADGSVVEKEAEPGETAEALAEVAEEAGSPVQSAEVAETRTPLPWRRIAITTVVVLAIALGGIWTYEQVTDRSYGSGSDNARISNPFGGGGGSGGADEAPGEPGSPATDESEDADVDPVEPDEVTPSPTTPTPTPAPTPTPTPAPAPTPAPTPAG